jgi:flagellin
MPLSVNTNASALNAIQYLNQSTSELQDVQLRVNTGLSVRNSKDNAAIFAIAQNLRADRGALDAVTQSLDRSISVLDVSLAAAESIQDLLIQMKEKVVAAADAGLDDNSRAALKKDFDQLRDQIATMAKNAAFNGTNMIDGNAAPPAKPANLVAIVSPDAATTISVARQNMTLQAAGTITPATAVGAMPVGTIIQFATDTSFTTAADALALIDNVDNSIRGASDAMTVMGAGMKSMEMQRVFVSKLADTLDTGIGNLVDADLSRESARLQGLQVKQQLGVQALAIANQAPQSILSLFGR